MSDARSAFEVIDTFATDRGIERTVRRLFNDDGTIYLVAGYFTYNAYRDMRDDVVTFLDRSSENRLVVVVGPSYDQFSAKIAEDMWGLDTDGQVHLLKYTSGVLHAKLYFRDGPSPAVVLGSANLTRVAFEYNLELGVMVEGEAPDDPAIRPFVEWIDEVVSRSEPIRKRDLLAPVRLGRTAANWAGKGRLLPPRHVAGRVTPVLVVLLLFLAWGKLV